MTIETSDSPSALLPVQYLGTPSTYDSKRHVEIVLPIATVRLIPSEG